MNGIIIHKFCEHGVFHALPLQTLSNGELLVTINAAGVNPFDWKVRDGLGGDRPMPFVLGQDFAGIVKDVQGDVGDFAIGDRIFGIAGQHGSFAQITIIRPGTQGTVIGKIPHDVTDALAAALPTPGITGLAAIEALKAGAQTTIVIHGANGAVGSIATQVARQKGLRIIASVKGAPEVARALGADAVVDTSVTDLISGIKAEKQGGIDGVLDLVSSSSEQLMRFADVLRPGATIVSTNFAADVDSLQNRGIRAVNLSSLETPQASRVSLEKLAAMVGAGSLALSVAREVPYEDAADVLDAVKAGTMPGKTVLRVGDSDG